MNRTEILKILAIIEVAYPNWIPKLDMEKKKIMVSLWSELFAEDDPLVIANAVKAIIQTDTNGYAPSIAQIRAKAYEFTHDRGMSEIEAWGYVMQAMKNAIHHSIEEHAKMPLEVQMAVTPEQLKEWAQIDTEQLQTVIASNFQRSFRGRSKAYKENAMLPEGFRTSLAEEKKNMRIEINDHGEDDDAN